MLFSFVGCSNNAETPTSNVVADYPSEEATEQECNPTSTEVTEMIADSNLEIIESQGKAIIQNLGIPLRNTFSDTCDFVYARSIWDMMVYAGKLYIGCGDFGPNAGTYSGGLPVISFNLDSQTWSTEAILQDEQLSRFVVAEDRLLIPGTDPIGTSAKGNYYALENGEWNTYSTIPGAIHCFDILIDGDLFFAAIGSSYSVPNSVCVSTDNGSTFEKIPFYKDGSEITKAKFTQSGTYSSNFARTYNLFEYEGNVFATWWCDTTTICNQFSGIYRYNSSEKIFEYYCDTSFNFIHYSNIPTFDVIFKDRLIMFCDSIEVFSKDLTSTSSLSGYTGLVSCGKVYEDNLFFVTYYRNNGGYTNRLYKTSDLENCELVAEFNFPCKISSFCYDRGVFYFGTEGTQTEVGSVLSMTLTSDPIS